MTSFKSHPVECSVTHPLVALDWLQRELPDPEAQREYAQQRAIVVVTEAIAEAMEQAGLTRADIADRLKRTKGHISQVLSGRRNMTLRTLADLLWACDLELDSVKLSPLGQIICSGEAAREWHTGDGTMPVGQPQKELSWTLSDDRREVVAPVGFYLSQDANRTPDQETMVLDREPLLVNAIVNQPANLDLALAA